MKHAPRGRLRLLALICALLFFGAGMVVVADRGASRSVRVTLTKDGFSPAQITITAGETVTFVSIAGAPFWPASDPHPAHTIYSAFDPREPVPAGTSWSFTFTKVGTWPYHNHLDPSEHGTIVVRDLSATSTQENPPCTYAQAATDENCYESLVRNALATGGLDAAWKVFTNLYDRSENPQSCHWTAHFIGEQAYTLFKAGKPVPLSIATTYCGYGFYHGFMTVLLHDNPNPQLAISFCHEVKNQLGVAAENNCFHGIGHGFTPEALPKSEYGNAMAVLTPSLTICHSLFRNDPLTESICDSGTFDVLGDYMSEQQLGFSVNTSDPLGICFSLDQKYFVTCYTEMAPKLDSITNWDPSKILQYLTHVTDEHERQDIVRIAVGTMMQRDVALTNWDNYIRSCRALPSDLHASCVSGIVWGMIMHGEPQKEIVKPLLFCTSTLFTAVDRTACYGDFAHWLGLIKTPEQVSAVCAQDVPAPYQSACRAGNTPRP